MACYCIKTSEFEIAKDIFVFFKKSDTITISEAEYYKIKNMEVQAYVHCYEVQNRDKGETQYHCSLTTKGKELRSQYTRYTRMMLWRCIIHVLGWIIDRIITIWGAQ